jgi:hypothetical protein
VPDPTSDEAAGSVGDLYTLALFSTPALFSPRTRPIVHGLARLG